MEHSPPYIPRIFTTEELEEMKRQGRKPLIVSYKRTPNMAKNRPQQTQPPRPAQQPSGYDKFKPGQMIPPGDPRLAGVQTIPVPDDEESDPTEPTDTVPVEVFAGNGEDTALIDNPAQPLRPFEVVAKANQAGSLAEQEKIISDALVAAGPKNCDLPDPALMYNRVLTRGDPVPETKWRSDTPALLLESMAAMERIAAGNLLVPYAYQSRNQLIDLIAKTKAEYGEKPSDAQSGQGRAEQPDPAAVGDGAGGRDLVDAQPPG